MFTVQSVGGGRGDYPVTPSIITPNETVFNNPDLIYLETYKLILLEYESCYESKLLCLNHFPVLGAKITFRIIPELSSFNRQSTIHCARAIARSHSADVASREERRH